MQIIPVEAKSSQTSSVPDNDCLRNTDNKLAECESLEQIHARADKQQPNIILMLVDDLGYGDLSSGGHPTSYTPVLDKLAEQSKVFTQYYVTSPVCSPSR